MVEFWRSGSGYIATDTIKATEAEGWDGQTFQDSLNLSPNPWVLMGAGAMVTQTLKLATGVTNPQTRHIAVTAAGAAGLQLVSGGRAVLGIGRGGLAPIRLAEFERSLNDLQGLLSGGKIVMPPFSGPTGLDWLPRDLPKVPLDVAATGQKVIEMAAPLAERLTFSMGAIPERIEWALDTARAARIRKGLAGAGVACGAQVLVICHRDIATALQFARFAVPALARFQLLHGQAPGPMSPDDAANFAIMQHGFAAAQNKMAPETYQKIGAELTPEFLQRFAIVGPPENCTQRVLELARLGIRHLVVVGPGAFPDGGTGRSLFAAEVLPAVRAALGG